MRSETKGTFLELLVIGSVSAVFGWAGGVLCNIYFQADPRPVQAEVRQLSELATRQQVELRQLRFEAEALRTDMVKTDLAILKTVSGALDRVAHIEECVRVRAPRELHPATPTTDPAGPQLIPPTMLPTRPE